MTLDAAAIALAARFAPGAVTPPVGLTNIRSSSADPPNQLPPTPCVLVFMDSGTFSHFPGKRDGVHTMLVRFYLDQIGAGDIARLEAKLRDWLDVLTYQLQGSVQLGGIVSLAEVSGWRKGVMDYAGQTYAGLELSVRVVTNEPWSAVA